MAGCEEFDQSKARLDKLLLQIAQTETRVQSIERSAARKSYMMLGLSSSVVLAQFGIIFWGTFEVSCWDIMEPVCYLMTLGNFTAGYLFYLLQKKDLELTNLQEILTHKFKSS